jgi:hypothetical protein
MLTAFLGNGFVPEQIPDEERDGQLFRKNKPPVTERNGLSHDRIAPRIHGYGRIANDTRYAQHNGQARVARAGSPSRHGKIRVVHGQRQDVPQTRQGHDQDENISSAKRIDGLRLSPQTMQTSRTPGSVHSASDTRSSGPSARSQPGLPAKQRQVDAIQIPRRSEHSRTSRTSSIISAPGTISQAQQHRDAKDIIREAQQLTPKQRAIIAEQGDIHSTSLNVAFEVMRAAKSPSPFTALKYQMASDLEKKLFAAACDILIEESETCAPRAPIADDVSKRVNKRQDSVHELDSQSASPELTTSPATSHSTQTSHGEVAIARQGSLVATITNISTVCKFWQWPIALPVRIEMQVTAIDEDYDVQGVLDKIRQTCEDMAAITARADRVNDQLSDDLAARASIPTSQPLAKASVNGSCRLEASAASGGEPDSETMPSAEDAAEWLREGIF